MADSKKCKEGYVADEFARGSDGTSLALVHDEEHGLSVRKMVPLDAEGPGVHVRRGPDGRYRPVTTGHAGPPNVNSEAYRAGWTNIFGKQTVGQA